MKANLPAREPETVAFWRDSRIYEKMLKAKGPGKFVLHDGPPYANGVIHIGHALNKILKDVVVKYKAMRNYYTPYVPGWDCHGLPIEYQLFKDLKTDKRKTDRIEFRKKAREFAMKYVEIQKSEFIRLGVLGDWDNPYLTMSPRYEATIIRTFGELAAAGYIYRAKKPIYWCTHCETALADAEVEYADSISPSIYVKFRVTSVPRGAGIPAGRGDNLFVLVWTTTPWTLPANVAVAFSPNNDYVVIEMPSGEKYILAEKLLETVAKTAGLKDFKVVHRMRGSTLEGIECENPLFKRKSVGILAGFISMEDGTGVVHIAPGHGVEDYSVGLKYKLEIISPVNERGVFTPEAAEFAGHRVFAANPMIVKKLREKGLLLHTSDYTHSYPHCWRCKYEVIFRATDQWFLSVEHKGLRKRLIEAADGVRWIPPIGLNRITGMLESRPDWCLSRQRYWGVPIPAIYCESCNQPVINREIIVTYAKIAEEETSDAWFTRPVSDFLPKDFRCGCGGSVFRKETDILDVWFDSGVSSEAVLRGSGGAENWPADMYLEGSDQHRGWFQTSLIPAVALRYAPPYRAVLTHGFTVDGSGKKMSKSLGNVVAPQEIMKNYGAEILRLWASSCDYSEDVRISKEIIERLAETYRKIRNTIRFLIGNLCDFDPNTMCLNKEELLPIDRWALHRLQTLIGGVTKSYDEYNFHSAVSAINNFCVRDLSGFYLDVLKDRLYTFGKDSRERRAAQTVLYETLLALLKLSAPVLSFTAEEAWRTFREENPAGRLMSDSVFLDNIPPQMAEFLDEALEGEWTRLVNLRDRVNLELENMRKSGEIGSSLEAKVILSSADPLARGLVRKYLTHLPAVFIVSQVEEGTESIEIAVRHADGRKCARCWNWSKEVDGRELCPRCSAVLARENRNV
jgi:isoleucyl-tRNA synthetase